MACLGLRNGRYFVDYRVNGRRYRKAVGKSKRIAELALKDIEVKIERNDIGFVEKDVELNKLFEEFLGFAITHHAPKTQCRYKSILDNFKRFLGKFPYIKKASQLESKFFEDYQTFRKTENAANKMINIEIQCLRAMFNLAIKWNYLWANPTNNVLSLREDYNKTPRFLSKEEIKALLENCDGKIKIDSS